MRYHAGSYYERESACYLIIMVIHKSVTSCHKLSQHPLCWAKTGLTLTGGCGKMHRHISIHGTEGPGGFCSCKHAWGLEMLVWVHLLAWCNPCVSYEFSLNQEQLPLSSVPLKDQNMLLHPHKMT